MRLEMLPSKADVIAAFCSSVREELVAVEAVAALARDEASSEETKQEGKYDTRATEASYLARGQAARVVSLRRLLSWFEQLSDEPLSPPVVKIRALVALSGRKKTVVFVAPTGGPRVSVGGVTVQAISMTSPLGEAMEELEVGDEVELESPRGLRRLTITDLC